MADIPVESYDVDRDTKHSHNTTAQNDQIHLSKADVTFSDDPKRNYVAYEIVSDGVRTHLTIPSQGASVFEVANTANADDRGKVKDPILFDQIRSTMEKSFADGKIDPGELKELQKLNTDARHDSGYEASPAPVYRGTAQGKDQSSGR